MSGLTEFLLARIAEDETLLTPPMSRRMIGRRMVEIPTTHVPKFVQHDRWAAECEAKRRIVEFHTNWPVLVEGPLQFKDADGADVSSMTLRVSRQIAWLTQQEYVKRFGAEPPTTPILCALAAVYADHPDYQEEWRMPDDHQ